VNWKRKLGSRKFWALAAGVATSVLVLVGAGEDTAVKITGVISAVGTVVVYILAEATIDAANKGSDEDADSN
jgi:siroheme synthase (precorrin-2 oxidase/ferrochelatase)